MNYEFFCIFKNNRTYCCHIVMASDQLECGHLTGHCEFPKGTWQSHKKMRLLRPSGARNDVRGIFFVPRNDILLNALALVINDGVRDEYGSIKLSCFHLTFYFISDKNF